MHAITPSDGMAATHVDIDGRRVVLRPLRPQDAAADRRFLEGLSPESRRERFRGTVTTIDDRLLHLMMSEDAGGPLAVVATVPGEQGEDIVGVARIAPDADGRAAECAVAVADAWQHHGLGHRLFEAIADVARRRGLGRLYSVDSSANVHMREFAHSVGAHARRDPDDATQVIYELALA